METKNTGLGVVAVLAIIGSLVYLYFTQFASGPKVNLKPFENLGYVVGEETAKLINNQGRVVVITEVFEALKSPNTEMQVKGFKLAVEKAGVQIKDIKEFKRPMEQDPQHWPEGQAGRFVNMVDGASAAVLFVSLPQSLTPDDIAALKESKTKLVFVTGQSPLLKKLLLEGAIAMGIVNRFPPKPAPGGSETARQWFDRVYMVAKPGALGELQ